MDDPKDPWARENSLPIREIDIRQKTDGGEDASQHKDDAHPDDGIIRSIVPAPRPFAYRRPLGGSEPEDFHPNRRSTDTEPQK